MVADLEGGSMVYFPGVQRISITFDVIPGGKTGSTLTPIPVGIDLLILAMDGGSENWTVRLI
jgi:hypothetical protein